MENQFLITDSNPMLKYQLYMTFSLANKCYAAPAQSIVEVIKLPLLHIPENLPENIVGILNLRGTIINIVDVRSLLGIESNDYSTEDCILVLSHEQITYGLIVDSVNNVLNISSDQITSAPYNIPGANIVVSQIAKTQDGLLGILNLDFIRKIVPNKTELEPLQSLNLLKKNDVNKVDPFFKKDQKSFDIFQRRANELQRELNLSIERERSQDKKFVTFLLNNEMYAISLQYIREFIKILKLSLVPCVPEFYIGLSNLRGEFIPVLDIKGFLGISKTEITEKTKIIFVRTPKMQLGIIVDEVFDIINVPSDKINKSGGLIHQQMDKNKYITGEIILDNKTVINIFEVEKFMQEERLIIEEAV